MADTYRPRLRAAVAVEDGDPPILRDAARDLHLPLEPWQRAALPLIDGTRDTDAVRAALAGALGADAPGDPVEVAYFLKSLRYLRLTDDAPASAIEPVAEAVRDPKGFAARAPWQVLPDAQFSCQMCGACCGHFGLGPLRPADLARLDALPGLEERFPHVVALGGRYIAVNEGGATRHYLPAGEDARCGYLLGNNLCGLHAAYGPDSKPAMCHLFPTSVVLTVEGKHVFDRAECRSYGQSAFAGASYASRVRELAPLLEESAEQLFFHPLIDLDGYLRLDYGLFLPFESHLVATTAVPRGTALDVLDACRDATLHLLVAITGADEAARTPDDVVAAVAAVPPAARFEGRARPPERRRGRLALAELYAGAVEALDRPVDDKDTGIDDTARFTLRAAALICQLEARGTSPLAIDGSAEVRRVRDAARTALDLADPRVDRRLRKLIRDVIFGKQYVASPTWLLALLELGAIVGATLVGARLRAAGEGRSVVTDDDLDDGQARALKTFRSPRLRCAMPPIKLGPAYLDGPALPLVGAASPPA